MKALSIARACVMGAILIAGLAAGCGAGNGGGPDSLPIDPFGTESTNHTGNESPGGSNESPPPMNTSSIEQLCAQACAHIQSSCPGASTNASSCPSDCASSVPPGCEQQFRAFVACIATAQLVCSTSGGIQLTGCEAETAAINACPGVTSGGSSAGGGGTAGASGGSV